MRTHRFVFTVIAVAALAAVAAPRALAFEESTAVGSDAELEAIVEDYEEEHYEEEVEFCGDGEETPFMLAWYEYEAQSYEGARAILVDAIKHGTIDPWDRANALTLLGEVQLRMGDYRPAVHNFRRAIEVDPSLAESGVGFGYAMALHGIGQREEALELARARAAACGADATSADCYGAFALVSALTGDATEMFEAMRSADSIVRGYPEVAEQIGWISTAIERR